MTLPLDTETPGLPAGGGHGPGAARAPLPRSTVGDETDPAGGNLAKGPAGSDLVHIVGVDLSLTGTGIACTHGARTIGSTGKADATLAQRQQRLRHLRDRIVNTVTDCAASSYLVVIEQPAYSRTGGHNHDRSGAWWLLLEALATCGMRVMEMPPTTVKKYGTGRGGAPKDEVLAAAIKRLPVDVVNNNEADAAWLCAIGHDLLGTPLVTLPAAQHAAIDKHRPTVGTGSD